MMKEYTGTILVCLWLYGALVFWPVMRFLLHFPADKLRELKWQFWLQAVGLTATLGLVRYFRQTPLYDWLHSMLLPYVVGSLGWITALVILLAMAMQGKKSGSGLDG